MLTADLVRARTKDGELVLRPLSAKERLRALELATTYLDIARQSVGSRRADLEEAWDAVPIGTRERRLADGLRKLIEDASELGVQAGLDPAGVRSDVFLAASAARQGAGEFDRAAILAAAASARGLSPEELEQSLYADLRSEEILTSVKVGGPEAIVQGYEHGQVQAVLLRAVRIVADVRCAAPAAYRRLFRALKFRRLLHEITAAPGGGYRIEIDGPYSLFESVTKYGLELALVLPALEDCDELTLVAQVRWGKERTPLVFRHERRAERRGARTDIPRLRDDVGALAQAIAGLDASWSVREASDILEIPGVGLCVPDLVFENEDGRRAYFEALGFWSRDAVWKRIELASEGLGAPILFAVSSRLRVSEAALDGHDSAALYTYKGTMSPRAVLKKVEALAARVTPP